MGVEPGLALWKELKFMVGERDTRKNIAESNSKFLIVLLYFQDHQIKNDRGATWQENWT